MSVRHKILILDTTVLCVWLKVTDYEICGPDNDRWDFNRVDRKINEEIQNGTYLVLPLATIVETGNHITHARGDKYKMANDLVDIIHKSADGTSPWVAFSAQSEMWKSENLIKLADRWLTSVNVLSLGDASIVDVAEYYSANYDVEILTGDMGLNAYQPSKPRLVPRRNQR